MHTPFKLTGVSDEGCSSLAQQLACHTQLGWQHLELRSVDNVPVASLSERSRFSLCDALRAQSFEVVALASQIGNWGSRIDGQFQADLDELQRLLQMASRLGCGLIRVMSYPNCGWSEANWQAAVVERFKRLVEVAEQADVVLVHENCAGWAGQSAEHTLELLDAVGSAHLKLLFDIGNGLSYGYEALDFLRQVLPHVAHVHLKDGYKAQQQVHYSFPGDGQAQARACIDLLLEHQYTGWFSIEPHLCLIPHLQLQGTDARQQRHTYQDYARQALDLLASCQEVRHAVHA
ncbi:TPA: sugar phosphate isomerase/epimerase [Pseudomonas putida]|uniref:sugar phosphate isomerase/epimerase family protein n=1 Tax=Pseudomonas TaxID=286 RepID=UPI00110CBFBD|nr:MULTISPECIES: sugar phosphate isomerase/epimerase family protein [Pseudomonas]MDD1995066.1 sugar phosphate isomerase/epimerase [Pseudomonas putida]HDS0919417.1 sugar phosphate isomerase/epimerase [Pseudomonas putida]HDS0933805.1 sugar phosphate isomerase/epimerase [Pseudomonas putida]HDS1783917.1 sugar phosphate isomerase/epimerase [Pseudomonas putida]HDS3799719.1 sugar phosphate isomerase/epimerase [Pseudomonas putida]